MSAKACDTAFRITSIVKMLHKFLGDISPDGITAEALKSVLDNEHNCCGNCVHQCTTCKGKCKGELNCVKFLCQQCGVAAKDCEFHKIMKAHSVCMELSNIQEEECKNFEAYNTPFAAFPHCRTLMQLFHYHIFDAVNSTSSFLLKKKNIDREKHEDNLMNARMIFRLSAEDLRYLFEKKDNAEDLKDQLVSQVEGIILLFYYNTADILVVSLLQFACWYSCERRVHMVKDRWNGIVVP